MTASLIALLYGLLELATLLLFLHPYAQQGLSRPVHSKKQHALLFAMLLAMIPVFGALRLWQNSMNMILNILLHFAVVTLVARTLYAVPLMQALNSSLVFHLSLDMCKSLIWDMIPFFSAFRGENSPRDLLMLTLPLMIVHALLCLVLRRFICRQHDRRMNKTMAALIFVPAIPYLYVKSLQYRSFILGDVTYSGTMSSLCFLVCLLAIFVSVLSNRLVEGIDRERQAEHAQLTIEHLEAEMAQHQRQIDDINKLSHDMRNHLATLAAMSGSKEAEAYIATLNQRFAPIAGFMYALRESARQRHRGGFLPSLCRSKDHHSAHQPARLFSAHPHGKPLSRRTQTPWKRLFYHKGRRQRPRLWSAEHPRLRE